MQIYDITRTINPMLAVWPGDTSFSFEHLVRKQDGNAVNLTTLRLSAHTGTHADAPYHYEDAGAHPAALPLTPYIGRTHVATITRQHGGILPSDFDSHDLTGMGRLLIHTWCSDLPDNEWPQDFPYPTVELIDWLATRGVSLLGVDMPSMDDFHSKTLDAHHRLRHHGMVNLESLALRDVPDSVYELIALPLKIDGVCASPVRAILRTL
jgi:arylformamidase